jgi:hypothetical protein
MTYLSAVAQRWPIARISTKVILAFALATLLAWLATDIVFG